MDAQNNGVSPTRNGKAPTAVSSTPRTPRRIVRLEGDEQSEPVEVLAQYEGAEITGARLHTDLQRLAREHTGELLAAEWLGPLGWTRFLWCRR
jgi:hypothetical protein